jgi:hypothetical protein
MAGWTNRGKRNLLATLRGVALPTNFFVALFTSAVAPTQDTNVKSELTEIAAGNGYTAGGISLTKNTTDFDVLTEDDTNDWALIQAKDLVWTAATGNLPASGNGARWACLTDDNATQASREIWAYWSLVGQTLTLIDVELRITE